MENLFRKAIFGIFLVFFNFLAASSLHAQSSPDWSLQAEQDGVKFYAATMLCANTNMLVYKIENSNAELKHVSYSVVIESAGRHVPVLPQSISIAASETKVGDCDSNKELITDLKGIDNYHLKVMMFIN